MAKRKTTAYKSKKTRDADDVVARRKDPNADDTTHPEVKWWLAETGLEASERLWSWVTRLRAQWAVDGIADLIHEAIYADEPIARGGMFDGTKWVGGHEQGQCVLNAVKSLVDTAAARLTKVRSMPCITASDADYEDQEFAKDVSGVLRRKMGGEDVEEAAPLLVRDFCIRGTSVAKILRRGGDTATKRIPIYEVVYDHREAQFDAPRVYAHVRPEPREIMMRRYPRFAEVIRDAPKFNRIDPWMQFVYQGPQLADLIEVCESWHLTACEDGDDDADSDDGQHIVCLRNGTVCREPWLAPKPPLVFSYWTAPIKGVRGKGLVAEHSAAQDFINGILHDAREAIHEAGQTKLFVPRQANVNKNHLRRKDGITTVEVDGDPRQVQAVAPNVVSQQSWNIAFQVKSEMYSISGVPEWQAAGKKPLGNGASGKAIDTMDDIVSDRFAQVETGWQQGRVAIGRGHVYMARHMYCEAQGDYADRFDESPDPIDKGDLAEWIGGHDWKKVQIDRGDYHLTIEPVNFITGARGGKLEEIAEAGKAGLIPDPTMTAALMDEPDIQAMNRPILGPMNRIKMCISGLKKKSVDYMDIAPDDAMNLSLAKLMAKGELEQAKADRAPDWIIERFNNFLTDIKAKEDQATQGAPSLPGAQANNIVAQPNAATLQPGGGPPMAPPPMAPGPGMGGPGLPPGMS